MTDQPRSPDQRREQCAERIITSIPRHMQSMRQLMRDERQGMSVPQFRSLLFLGRNPGSTLADVGAFIGVGAPTASAMVKTLQRRGLVLAKAGADRRTLSLRPSASGQSLIERIRTAGRQKVAQRLSGLSAADLGRLEQGLAILDACLAEPSASITERMP